jgi:hypothetical protein
MRDNDSLQQRKRLLEHRRHQEQRREVARELRVLASGWPKKEIMDYQDEIEREVKR